MKNEQIKYKEIPAGHAKLYGGIFLCHAKKKKEIIITVHIQSSCFKNCLKLNQNNS